MLGSDKTARLLTLAPRGRLLGRRKDMWWVEWKFFFFNEERESFISRKEGFQDNQRHMGGSFLGASIYLTILLTDAPILLTRFVSVSSYSLGVTLIKTL